MCDVMCRGGPRSATAENEEEAYLQKEAAGVPISQELVATADRIGRIITVATSVTY